MCDSDTSNALVSLSYGITQYYTCHQTEVILTPLLRHVAGTHLSATEG